MTPLPTGTVLPSGSLRTLAPGTMVGEYCIDGMIGQGGMGSVYAAHHPVIEKQAAIKVLERDCCADAGMAKRFIDEARSVNRIGHPNIVDIFAFGQLPDGRQYFVMEQLDGMTLADHLEAGPLPLGDARRVILQVCDALEAAHGAKIVHRDLKPANIFLARPKHGPPIAKLLDFGVAKLADNTGDGSAITRTGVVLGTAFFMSPEQCLGQPVDARSDVYAMGVILYLMFTGTLPFRGSAFAEVVAQHVTSTPVSPASLRAMSPALERLILSCLAKAPAQRPQGARALALALTAALGEPAPSDLATQAQVVTQPEAPPLPSSTGRSAPTGLGRGDWPRGLVWGTLATSLVLAALGWALRRRGASAPEAASPLPAQSPQRIAPASELVPPVPMPAGPPASVPAAFNQQASNDRGAAAKPARTVGAAAPRALPAPARRSSASPQKLNEAPPDDPPLAKENPFRP